MKFDKFIAFYRHLETSREHPSTICAVLMSSSDERKEVLKWISSFRRIIEPSLKIEYRSMEGALLRDILQALQDMDLFAKERLLVFDDIEKCSKAVFEDVVDYLEKQDRVPIVFLGEQFPFVGAYERLKNKMVVLSLSTEKPWERRDRIKQWTSYYVASYKKKVEESALEYLLDVTQQDFVSIKQEVDKWVCFSVDKQMLSLEDLKKVCQLKAVTKQWNLAEAIVWYKSSPVINEALSMSLDQHELLALLGGIRYHAHVGIQLSDGESKKLSILEIQKKVPQVQPRSLEKYLKAKTCLSPFYFEKVLTELVSIEFRLKTASEDPTNLWKQLVMKLELSK